MRIYLVVVLFFLSVFNVNAQHLYPKGKYYTINQLVYDSMEPKSACDVYVKSESLYTQYIIYDSISGKKILPVLAYSDGKDLYLNEGIFGSGKFYVKSLEKGRYYYFEGIYFSSKLNVTEVLLFGFIGAMIIEGIRGSDRNSSVLSPKIDFTDVPTEKLCGLVFDTQTGNFIGLSTKNIERVFANEPEIISYFADSPRKIEDIRKCVKLFNEKYKE